MCGRKGTGNKRAESCFSFTGERERDKNGQSPVFRLREKGNGNNRSEPCFSSMGEKRRGNIGQSPVFHLREEGNRKQLGRVMFFPFMGERERGTNWAVPPPPRPRPPRPPPPPPRAQALESVVLFAILGSRHQKMFDCLHVWGQGFGK